MNYVAANGVRPVYHANDSSKDVLTIDSQPVRIEDGRETHPRLETHGFELIEHKSRVGDFTDVAGWTDLHQLEIAELVKAKTGADLVIVNGPGLLRFGEKSKLSGKLNNSKPARFAHVDVSDKTAAVFGTRGRPEGTVRQAHFNVWRAISAPPQDVPLAFCDARSVAAEDLISSDAVFDDPVKPHWSFEGLTVAANAAHRWSYFSDMNRDEVVIFTTNDSDPAKPHCVPHCAFDDARVPAETPPRASIEMRAVAYWTH
jgi:hypothetical protein